MNRLRRWLDSDTLLAYGLLLAIIAIVATLGMILFQPAVSQIFQDTKCLQCA